MPASPQPASPDSHPHVTPNSAYRSETSYRKFASFLNRELIVQGKQPAFIARFSLLDVLKHLNIEQATLKGSAVHQWEGKNAPADIDLQLSLAPTEAGDNMLQELLKFVHSRQTLKHRSDLPVQTRTWFRKASHDMGAAWSRMIVSVGYPRPGASTLDFNFTSSHRIAFDTINASRAIQFDWVARKAAHIDSWHPHIVQWIRQTNLLWFSPDIENGLGRLSYRLSKSSALRLLQPELVQHFCQQADAATLANVYLRVLRNEYPNSVLSASERAALWKPVVEQITEQAPESNPHLQADLLAWSKYGTIENLLQALACPNRQCGVMNALGKALQVSENFKSGINTLLLGHPEFKTHLSACVDKALGAQPVETNTLFALLDQWADIHDMPEHELLELFAPILKHLPGNSDTAASLRANHMLAWLDGDDLGAMKFWMDRIPKTKRSSPSEKALAPLLDSAVQVIRAHGPAGLAQVLPDFSEIRLQKPEWEVLCRALLACKFTAPVVHGNTPELLVGALMQLIARHALVLSTMLPNTRDRLESTSNALPMVGVHHDLMELARQFGEQKIPQILKSVVSGKAGEFKLHLPDMRVNVILSTGIVTFTVDQIKHLVTNRLYASLRPSAEHASVDEVTVLWEDGTLMTAQVTENNPTLKGQLSNLLMRQTPDGLTGLIHTGRALCASAWPGRNFDDHHLFAVGQFNAKQLWQSGDFLEALLTLRHGVICDNSLERTLKIQHEIVDSKPVRCSVQIEDQAGTPDMILHYDANPSTPVPDDFQNAWHCAPSTQRVETRQLQVTPSVGVTQVKTWMPWDAERQAFNGQVEVRGEGPAPFTWNGRIQADGKLLPQGSLTLASKTAAAIVFDADQESMNIPYSLLPIMADLLGERLNGTYPFQARVWSNPDQWPAEGFEGFISNHRVNHHWFSGYLTSTGQAIGILNSNEHMGLADYVSRCGGFQVKPAAGTGRTFPQEPATQARLAVPLAQNRVLIPHGMVRHQYIGKLDHEVHHTCDWIYFEGVGFPVEKMSQENLQVYEAPNQTQYWVGQGFTSKEKKAVHIDVVFNAGDGGFDYQFIRPVNYHTLKHCNEIYRDAQGMSAVWTIVDDRLMLGNVDFPCGLQYHGEIGSQNDFLCFEGRGKLSFKGIDLTAVFHAESASLGQIKGKN